MSKKSGPETTGGLPADENENPGATETTGGLPAAGGAGKVEPNAERKPERLQLDKAGRLVGLGLKAPIDRGAIVTENEVEPEVFKDLKDSGLFKLLGLVVALAAFALASLPGPVAAQTSGTNFEYPSKIGWGGGKIDQLPTIFAAQDVLFTGVRGGVHSPVADITALKAIAATGATARTDKQLCYVESGPGSVGALYAFDSGSSATGNDDTVVQPASGTGRWLKVAVSAFGGTMVGGLVIAPTGALSIAIDLTDTDIVTALSLGANDVTATHWGFAGASGEFTTAGPINANGGIQRSTPGALVIGSDGVNSTAIDFGASTKTITAKGPANFDEGVTMDATLGVTGMSTLRGATLDTATATDDLVIYQVTAGGAGRFTATLSPLDLTADRALRYPDAAGTFALTADKLSSFASTTSAELGGVISDETGSGLVVYNATPTLRTNLTIDTATATDDLFSLSVTTGGAGRFTTTLSPLDATADRLIRLPDADGTVALAGAAPTAHAASHTNGTDDVATMVGDAGAGGTKGLVGAPAAGDAAAGKYWKADGTWAVPPDTTYPNAPSMAAGATGANAIIVSAGADRTQAAAANASLNATTGVASFAHVIHSSGAVSAVPAQGAVTVVQHTGDGTFTATMTGAPKRTGTAHVTINTPGEVGGLCTINWQMNAEGNNVNGGGGFPCAGSISLTTDGGIDTGITIQMVAGDPGDDFDAGDEWSFPVTLTATSNTSIADLTVDLRTPISGEDTITFTNSLVNAASIPFFSLGNVLRQGTATTGEMTVRSYVPGAGTMSVILGEDGGAAASNGTWKLGVLIPQ